MGERSSPNRPRTRRRPPDFAPSSKTPGGYVGQAVLEGRVLSQSKFAPTPGGEPLRHVSGDLAIFCLASRLTQKCCDTGLPRITAMQLPVAPIRLHPALELRTGGSFRGAARFHMFRPG